MIVADNGSDWYVSGAPDPRWSTTTSTAGPRPRLGVRGRRAFVAPPLADTRPASHDARPEKSLHTGRVVAKTACGVLHRVVTAVCRRPGSHDRRDSGYVPDGTKARISRSISRAITIRCTSCVPS